MANLPEYVEHYVSQLSGPNAEDACHSLVEAGPGALPHVVEAFDGATDPNVRSALVAVISEYRSAEGVPFLTALLRDRDAGYWKAALDGLVMVGGPAALEALASTRGRSTAEQREWIDEAIGQIIEARPG
jgi:HEAT repeat protein